jgi:membrane protein YqaA with SNARE-associated domain
MLLGIKIWLVILIVSALGAIVTLAYYYLGKEGVEAVFSRFPQIDTDRWSRVQHLYEKHGSGLLFLSFIPMIGVLLSTAAGAFGISLWAYLFWVWIGRVVRNWVLVQIFDQALAVLVGR